ncbi:MAG: hypothetical protein RSG78_06945, partial [Oscillospiraceae bacterium]
YVFFFFCLMAEVRAPQSTVCKTFYHQFAEAALRLAASPRLSLRTLRECVITTPKLRRTFYRNLPKLRFASRLCRDYRFAIEIVV